MRVEARLLSPWESALIEFGLLAVLIVLLLVVLIPYILATKARQRRLGDSSDEPQVVLPARPKVKGRPDRSPSGEADC